MHKSQVFLCFVLAFILGVGVASIFVWPYLVSIILISAGLFLVVLFWHRKWFMVVVGISVVLFVCGALRHNTTKLDQGILTQFTNKVITKEGKTSGLKVELVGYVQDEPRISGDKQIFTLSARKLMVPNYTTQVDENVQISTRIHPKYHYGQTLMVTGMINTPYDAEGDSYKNYLSKDGVFTTMLYPEISDAEFDLGWWQKQKIGLFSKIFSVKDAFEASLGRSISKPSSSFISGILLGTRSQIPDNIKDAFERTSLTHVLAISGYNVTIIANIIVAALLWVMRRQRAFWFAVAMIFVFTVMTGAQASVVRAALMGILVLLARHQGRFYNVKNAVALAAAVMVFFNPLALSYDVGFQLSFMATLGLIYLSPQIGEFFKRWPKSTLKETLVMTLSAQIFVLPLLIYYFGNFSVISIPANLIILPTIPITMLLGFFAGVAGLILPILGQIIGYFAWCLATVQLKLVQLFAEPSWAAVTIVFTMPMVIVSYLLLFTLVFRDKINKVHFRSRRIK